MTIYIYADKLLILILIFLQPSDNRFSYFIFIHRDYYQSVFVYRQYHVLGIKIVLFPIHDTADTQIHEGNNLFII